MYELKIGGTRNVYAADTERKEMADMFEQMSKEKQEIMIELAKRMQTEEPEKLLKEIKQRLHIDDV